MTKNDNTSNGANLDFEKKLWEMTDNPLPRLISRELLVR
jgi:hypothetical protein